MNESEDVFVAAHDATFRMSDIELCNKLAARVGRLTVARITGVPDVSTVSRWATGRNCAVDSRLDRMRHATYLLNALVGLGFTESAAVQWLRSPHPSLADEKPVDVIARGDLKLAMFALRQHARKEPPARPPCAPCGSSQ